MSWTDERVALLRQLWGEGKTAAEIAKTLGDGVTRNAVIGKAHRLKLSGRVSPIQQNTNKKPKAPVAPMIKKVPTAPPAPIVEGKRIKLADLRENMCRWPMGDPQDEDFGFCGHQSSPGLPYCEAHAKTAYQIGARVRTIKVEDIADDSAPAPDFDIKHAASG